MLLRTLYYWKKLRDFERDPPESVQQTMLRSVIEAAARTTVYDIEPDTDLKDIPILSDEALRKMTHTEGTARDVACLTSSGTTGTVRTTEIDTTGYDWIRAYTLDLYTRLGWRPGQPILVSPQSEDNQSSLLGRYIIPSTSGELQDYEALVQQINTIEPAIIESYPRILVAAARADTELTHTPSAIIVTGELLTPQMRQDLESTFNTPVLNLYGVAEVGRIAIDATGDGFDLLPSMTRTELPTGIGHPITTTLINTRTPIVRYRLPDLVEADGEDTISRILGRERHVLEQDGEQIYPADIIEQIYQHPEILEFTVHDGHERDLHIEVVTRNGKDPEDELAENLASLGLTATTTVTEGPLPTTAGGKKRAFEQGFGGP